MAERVDIPSRRSCARTYAHNYKASGQPVTYMGDGDPRGSQAAERDGLTSEEPGWVDRPSRNSNIITDILGMK